MNISCRPAVVEFYESTSLHALQWTQFGFSIASIVVVSYTVAFYLRKSWFEGVFKETIYALYFFILWHSVLTAFMQGFQIIVRLSAKRPCDMQFDKRLCIVRIIVSFSYPSFVCLHAAVTTQRVVTTFSGNNKLHHVTARCCLLFTLLFCLVYTIVSFRGYSLEGLTPYCPGKVVANADILLVGTFFMMAMDILNVIVAFSLWRYNKRKIRELLSADEPLDVKFRYRQTLQSVEQMLPVACFHLLCFTAQYVGFEIGLKQPLPEAELIALNGFIYMMPYYCFLCPSILLYLMIKEKRRKKIQLISISNTTSEGSAEGYFSALNLQWESRRKTIDVCPQIPMKRLEKIKTVS